MGSRSWVARALAGALLAVAVAGCGEAEKPTVTTPGTTAEPGGDGEYVPPGLSDDAAEVPLPDLTATPKGASPPVRFQYLGADISWPQCPKGMGIPQRRTLGAPMPTAAARFVVIGLTNGPSFTPNPCLEAQVAWARTRNLRTAAYAVTSYPTKAVLARYADAGPYDGSTVQGALGNVGFAAAVFNVRNLKASGLPTPIIWVDVEPLTEPFHWSKNVRANRAVVRGTLRGYTDAGYRVGLYSTPILWNRIVGDLRLGLPEWRAAGTTSRKEALRRCRSDWSHAGGQGVLGQWVEADRDRNVTCPGAVTDVRDWFGSF